MPAKPTQDRADRARPPRLRLRAHHLLCVQGFRGLGYTDEFVANMAQVVSALQRNPMVEVALGPDAICRGCPHLPTRKSCSRPQGTIRDRAVILALEVAPGLAHRWAWWKARVAHHIPPAFLTEICWDCSWFPAGYCVAAIAATYEPKQGG